MTPLVHLIADGLVIPIVLIAAYALLRYVPNESRYQVYIRIVMAGLTAYLLAKVIGSAYQPAAERPFELLGVQPGALYLDNPGFPSDHALFTAFLAFAVGYGTRCRKLFIILASLAAAVCIGRVVALVHTPLDVIAGVVIAFAGSVWYGRWWSVMHRRPKRQKVV